MKKLLFFFLLAIAAISCSESDDSGPAAEFLLPIEDATVPETLILGQNATIMVKYRRPTDCHIFNGFYTDSNGMTQIVCVKALKFNEGNCVDDTGSLYEVPFTFVPNSSGTYHFKFWTGTYSNGEPLYLEYESVVE